MSMPAFQATPELSIDDAISQVVSSIAMEELALSHIINAEGEKLQFVLGTLEGGSDLAEPPTVDDLLAVNESVQDMLSAISMNQMFLFAKMSSALNALRRDTNGD